MSVSVERWPPRPQPETAAGEQGVAGAAAGSAKDAEPHSPTCLHRASGDILSPPTPSKAATAAVGAAPWQCGPGLHSTMALPTELQQQHAPLTAAAAPLCLQAVPDAAIAHFVKAAGIDGVFWTSALTGGAAAVTLHLWLPFIWWQSCAFHASLLPLFCWLVAGEGVHEAFHVMVQEVVDSQRVQAQARLAWQPARAAAAAAGTSRPGPPAATLTPARPGSSRGSAPGGRLAPAPTRRGGGWRQHEYVVSGAELGGAGPHARRPGDDASVCRIT